MKAMKCDRCGKIYIEGDGRNVKTIAINKQDWNGDYPPWEADFIDLCPSCLDELVDFLANKEEEKGEVKSNMNADPVKGILDELLKADLVSPLEIHFGDQFFNHYTVKGEDENE